MLPTLLGLTCELVNWRLIYRVRHFRRRLLRTQWPKVLLEGDAVYDGIAANHQRVQELRHLQ